MLTTRNKFEIMAKSLVMKEFKNSVCQHLQRVKQTRVVLFRKHGPLLMTSWKHQAELIEF